MLSEGMDALMNEAPSSLLAFLDTNGVATTLNSFFETQPYLSAFVTCSAKASAADFFTQTTSNAEPVSENKSVGEANAASEESPLDAKRNLAFWLYGGIYTGMVQQYFFSTLYPSLFGTEVTVSSVFGMVALDMAVLSPLLCLPVAYLVKAFVVHGEGLMEGIQRYITDVRHERLLITYYALWIPVQCLTFSVIPQHLRVVFVAAVSFFWIMILSSISSRRQDEAVETKTWTLSE